MKANLVAAVLALSLAASAASAQSRPADRPPSDPYAGVGSRPFPPHTPYRGPAGQVCVAWCPGDLNPCDPPLFKQADGRCMRNDG